MRKIVRRLLPCLTVGVLFLGACSSTRHVPAGNYLLDKVKLNFDSLSRTDKNLDAEDLQLYVRQMPNQKVLWSMRLRLGVYNMSGKDSTKWYNKWARKLGEPPVIYNPSLTSMSEQQLQTALINKGYLSAEVDADTIVKGRKIEVDYNIRAGKPHKIRSVSYEIPDSAISAIVMKDTLLSGIKSGDNLDLDMLDLQRDLITRRLRNRGYFNFVKENITFEADTTAGCLLTDLTMRIQAGKDGVGLVSGVIARQYRIRRVICVADYEMSSAAGVSDRSYKDTVSYRDITICYGEKEYLRPSIIYENNFLVPGEIYSEHNVDKTYKAFSRLEILKFINVRMEPAGSIGDTGLLDAYILLTPATSQSLAAELEGTNSAGDLGVAVGLTYSHRNIGKGSETFTAKVRGAYESVSGNLDGLIHNRYLEASADMGLQFPKFKAPFLAESFKRNVNASTELNLSINYQERPEYTRIVSTAGWSYKWTERSRRTQHIFTPIDINYVYLPASTNDFINQIAPDNPLLRYSYEDHFIMRLGYSFYHTNKRNLPPWQRNRQKDIYTVRARGEFAGNLLFALSSIFSHRSNFHQDPYKIFGIHYAQYFKFDSDFGYTHVFDERQSVATHVGLGVGVPYGNSGVLPFEKRFYGGGANGVRGWGVRTLGPGRFPGNDSSSDFMNKCGDIRFIMSAEYRAKLFWIVELGLFVDAGNIWTIRDYPNQPGGLFQFKSFYKELAASYGLGIRLDFNYFLLRFDLGMKAHNPAEGQESWPIIHPRWGRDRAFHFSIGYPF